MVYKLTTKSIPCSQRLRLLSADTVILKSTREDTATHLPPIEIVLCLRRRRRRIRVGRILFIRLSLQNGEGDTEEQYSTSSLLHRSPRSTMGKGN